MNKNKLMKSTAIAAMFMASSCVLLGFGLPKMGKDKGEPAEAKLSAEDVLAQSDAIFGKLTSATKELLLGNAYAAEAVGLKEESEKLVTAAEALGKGDAEEEIKKAKETSTEVQEAIEAKMDEASDMTEGQKVAFAKSLVHTGKGVYMEKELIESVSETASNAKDVISSAGAMQKAKLTKQFKPVMSLAKSLPGDVKTAASTLQMYMDFASKNDISIPEDATAALGADF